MDDKQAAEVVLRWAFRALTDAVSQNVRANAEFQGNQVAKETWNACNPDDGVGCMGTNPFAHNVEKLDRVTVSTFKTRRDWEYIHGFVTHRICNLIEE